MDKLILIVYLNVGNIDDCDIREYMEQVNKHMQNSYDSSDILYYVIPIKGKETYIDCVNPKLVSEEEYKKAITVMDNAKKAIDEFIKEKEEK